MLGLFLRVEVPGVGLASGEELGEHAAQRGEVAAASSEQGEVVVDGPGGKNPGAACRHDQLTAKLRAAGLGAIADLGFIGLDDSDPDADPAVITGYKAARNDP
ncbi:hypothetical protein [Streptomyces canus]|uniref:hypothetical protein n=1 Tax=Streptomyces canus TaxID=58343 RepID=UPI00324766D0